MTSEVSHVIGACYFSHEELYFIQLISKATGVVVEGRAEAFQGGQLELEVVTVCLGLGCNCTLVSHHCGIEDVVGVQQLLAGKLEPAVGGIKLLLQGNHIQTELSIHDNKAV